MILIATSTRTGLNMRDSLQPALFVVRPDGRNKPSSAKACEVCSSNQKKALGSTLPGASTAFYRHDAYELAVQLCFCRRYPDFPLGLEPDSPQTNT